MSSQNYQEKELLFRLARKLRQLTDVDLILKDIADCAKNTVEAEHVCIILINPDSNQTRKTVFWTGSEQQRKNLKAVTVNVSGWVATSGSSFISDNLKRDKRFMIGQFAAVEVASVIGAPLIAAGRLIGSVLAINTPDGSIFSSDDLSFLKGLSDLAAPHLLNAQGSPNFLRSQELSADHLIEKYNDAGMIGAGAAFQELILQIETAAQCGARVLIQGESGTGKELVAQFLHRFGKQAQGPFIAIDCGTLQENLIESKLFGSVRGAFTGAVDRKGAIESASGGTLFLDEIANLPLHLQAKLLRVLESEEIQPVGSNITRSVKFRLISACNVPLSEEVKKENFRRDLLYRINTFPINMPTLRDRREDIPLFIAHFLKAVANHDNKRIRSVDRNLMKLMRKYDWSENNIRELRNALERMCVLASAKTEVLTLDFLPPDLLERFNNTSSTNCQERIRKPLRVYVDQYEKKILQQVLEENNWNQSKAARILEVNEGTIRFKMKKLVIRAPREYP